MAAAGFYCFNCVPHLGKAWKGPTKVSPEAPNYLVEKGDVFMTPQAREPFLTAFLIDDNNIPPASREGFAWRRCLRLLAPPV